MERSESKGQAMNRREFVKMAVATVAGVSVGVPALTATGAFGPVKWRIRRDGDGLGRLCPGDRWLGEAGESVKGPMVYIAAEGRAHEAWIKRGLMSMAEFRKQVGAERAALLVMEQHPEMLRFIATDRAIC